MASHILLQDATIITFDQESNGFKIVSPGSLLIKGDRIAAIYDDSKPIGDLPADTERVHCKNKIISPGFVDTHRHGWQTAFRSLAPDTTLPEYFFRYGPAAARETISAEDIHISQLAGLYECINAGVTTTLDHAHHTWDAEASKAGLDASIDSGVRVYWCYTFMDLPSGFDHAQQLSCAEGLLQHEKLKDSPSKVGIAYDGWTQSPEDRVRSIVDFATKHNVPALTTHSLGGPWIINHGPALLHKHGILKTPVPVVISHASFMSPDDINLLREANQYISITPESEMHYGHDHEHNHEIMDQCALGIDTHFTFSTDMVTQARIWLQATRRALYREKLAAQQIGHPNPFDAAQAFYLATVAGGLALRRDDVGIINVGAKADLVVFDGESPNMLGFVDPIAAIILHSNVGDVEHVLIDGKWRKKDRNLLASASGEEWKAIKTKFLASAREIQKTWLARALPTIEGKFLGVTPYAKIDKLNVKKL